MNAKMLGDVNQIDLATIRSLNTQVTDRKALMTPLSTSTPRMPNLPFRNFSYNFSSSQGEDVQSMPMSSLGSRQPGS